MNKIFLEKALEETFEEKLLGNIPNTLPDANLPNDFKKTCLFVKKPSKKYAMFVAAIVIVLILPFGIKYFIDQKDDIITTQTTSNTTQEFADAFSKTHNFPDKIEKIFELELEEVSFSKTETTVTTEYIYNLKQITLKQFTKNSYGNSTKNTKDFIIEQVGNKNKITAVGFGYIFEISGEVNSNKLIKLYKSLKSKK